MTVSSTNRKQNFDGGQAELEFTFRALPEAPEDIKCIATSDAGVITYLEYNVDYTVAVNSDGIGGTVTLNPTFATTYTHTVYRETTIKQESDYDDYNPFPADTLETNIDRLTMIAQEERELGERTLKYPISSTGTDTNLPVPEAGKFIAWNAAGDGMENKDIPDPSTLIKASQAEAEAGTDNDNFMTPLRTKQAITALQDDDIPLSYLSTSGTLADNSDVKVASQKATKTYADTKLPSSYLDTDGDLTANSDVKVPSQKAVKTYVDSLPQPGANYQVFTSNGTWVKPSSGNMVIIEAWGGGGGGGTGRNAGGGMASAGGGGAYARKIIPLSEIAGNVSVVVGAGGVGGGGFNTNGNNGNNSSFSTYLVAVGGSRGLASNGSGGGGAGTVTRTGGSEGGWIGGGNGGGMSENGYASEHSYAGGGGAGGNTQTTSYKGGNAEYGGGGGGSFRNNSAGGGGVSIHGGNGARNNTAAGIPAGGGAGGSYGGESNNASVINPNRNGARGEVRVWVV